MERPGRPPSGLLLITLRHKENRAGSYSAVFVVSFENRSQVGTHYGGVFMAGRIQVKPPKRERTIDGTTYIVTSQFKQTGSTAADHIRRLIDMQTKSDKIRRIY